MYRINVTGCGIELTYYSTVVPMVGDYIHIEITSYKVTSRTIFPENQNFFIIEISKR